MTTSNTVTPARRRRATAAAAIFVAVLSVNTVAAPIVRAEPPDPSQGDIDAFNGCLWSALNAIKAKNGRFTETDVQNAATNCCENLAGTANTHKGRYVECYMPDGSTIIADEQGTSRAPLPTATAVLPPGSNTRTGIQ